MFWFESRNLPLLNGLVYLAFVLYMHITSILQARCMCRFLELAAVADGTGLQWI